MIRNHYMVDHSQRVIAVYDGRSGGGTAATIRYARPDGRPRLLGPGVSMQKSKKQA